MENWTNVKMLVAEDEMGNFILISALLEDTGIQITHAMNGREAIELCKKEQFDIIFMDLKMPMMDGFEATNEIRKHNTEITIIAQTAYAFRREECIAAGFTDYVSKPFNEEQLINTLSPYIKPS
jgi:CheY-like chemotaxis protein